MEKNTIAGIILAAGMSTRMGNSKLLMEAGGKILLARVVEAALESELDRVVLVLGHEAERIKAALGVLPGSQRFTTVINQRYQEGMSTSLQAGLQEVRDQFPAVMFLLGDQPLIDAKLINLLLHRFLASDRPICAPLCHNRQANPVCFRSAFYDRIMAIHGDKGARDIIHTHPDEVLYIQINDLYCFLDIDTREDAAKFLSLLKEQGSQKT